MKTEDGKEKKTAKGVLRIVKEREITHDNYKKCLFDQIQMKHKQTRIIQENHNMYTVEQNKVSLSPFNDKKWIRRGENEFTTYSFGNHKILEEELEELAEEAQM